MPPLPMLLIRRLAVLAISCFGAINSPVFARTSDPLPRLQVSLFNDARVDSATLAAAEARASAIFSQAGLEVDWLVCDPADPTDFTPRRTACSDLAWPAHLSVRIVPRARSVASVVFGQAFVDAAGQGVYSNIYYQNLSGPNRSGLTAGEVLGCVLAHELGHLLLGANSHSPSGLMQSHWDSSALHSAARSDLFFTPAQSATLRSRLP
ncbi:MAG: hypothetical protein NVS9B14_22240 [Candidatus Acidiferrum sp.]